MPTLSKINDILCSNISKIDDILKANASKIDDIDFCTPTATPTPTVTRGGTPTPTPSVTFTQTPTVTRTPASTVTPTVTNTPTVTPTPTTSMIVTKTATPSVTPTLTPTPTQTKGCRPGCCLVELCYDPDSCRGACECNLVRPYYLSIACETDPCRLGNASGIFDDDLCSTPAPDGYYSDGIDCYSWLSGVLTYDGPC